MSAPPRSYVLRLGPFTPDLKAGELHKAGYRLLVPVERKEAGPAAPNTGGRRAEQRSARAERCSALQLTCCLPSPPGGFNASSTVYDRAIGLKII